MKLKLIPIITGAVLLAATPFALKAVAAPGQQLAPATTQPATPPKTAKPNQLNLSPEQKDQMRQLHQETSQKIEEILDSEQLAKYQAAIESRRTQMQNNAGQMDSASVLAQRNGNRRQNIFASLNLSQDQKAKIREIMQSSRTRMSSILTDAQRTQIQEMMRARRTPAR